MAYMDRSARVQDSYETISSVKSARTTDSSDNSVNFNSSTFNFSFTNKATKFDFSSCLEELKENKDISREEGLFYSVLQINHDAIQDLEMESSRVELLNDPKIILTAYGPTGKLPVGSVCKKDLIDFRFTVNKPEAVNVSEFKEFKELGIDVTNIEDPFFNDICTSWTRENKDIILQHRRDLYYVQVPQICSEGPEQLCSILSVSDSADVECSCKGLRGEPKPDFSLTFWQESNFRIFTCFEATYRVKC